MFKRRARSKGRRWWWLLCVGMFPSRSRKIDLAVLVHNKRRERENKLPSKQDFQASWQRTRLIKFRKRERERERLAATAHSNRYPVSLSQSDRQCCNIRYRSTFRLKRMSSPLSRQTTVITTFIFFYVSIHHIGLIKQHSFHNKNFSFFFFFIRSDIFFYYYYFERDH